MKSHTAACMDAIRMASEATEDRPLVFVGKTLANAHYNICHTIRNFYGPGYIKDVSIQALETKLLGRTVRCVGANNASMMERVKGWNVGGIVCDEATTYPEAVFDMLITRTDQTGCRLVFTTNPEHPMHWLKRRFVDVKNDYTCIVNFTLDDNPLLTDEYKNMLHTVLRGAALRRYYYGEWAGSDGVVYVDFGDHLLDDVVDLPPQELICGIDFGLNHRTEAVMVAYNNTLQPKLWIPKALSIEQSPDNIATVSEVALRIVEWMSPYFPKTIYVDPSALTLSVELKRILPRGVSVVGADNDVLNGINFVSSLLHKKELLIDFRCSQLIKEFQSYCWDKERCDRTGKDHVVKSNDDGVDALRYALYSRYGNKLNLVEQAKSLQGKMQSHPYYKEVLYEGIPNLEGELFW